MPSDSPVERSLDPTLVNCDEVSHSGSVDGDALGFNSVCHGDVMSSVR